MNVRLWLVVISGDFSNVWRTGESRNGGNFVQRLCRALQKGVSLERSCFPVFLETAGRGLLR